jgi:hypothetical protein
MGTSCFEHSGQLTDIGVVEPNMDPDEQLQFLIDRYLLIAFGKLIEDVLQIEIGCPHSINVGFHTNTRFMP